VDGQDAPGGEFEIGEGGSLGNIEIVVASPAAEIFGVVLGPDGNNAPGSVVTITPEPFSTMVQRFQRMNTDQNGRFDFHGLTPGSYRIYAWDQLEAGEQYDPDLLKAQADKSVTATVAEGDKTLVTLTETVQ
jgi:hypothetical protein